MTQQNPPGPETTAEPRRPALYPREWFFNREVHEHAAQHGWRPFHTNGLRVMRGPGFPDVVMYRQHPETGEYEMLVAELKRDANSPFQEGQEDWIKAFEEMGVTARIWIADDEADRDEMYQIIEHGTGGLVARRGLVPEPEGPAPRQYDIIIRNTIEAIESDEMRSGEKAGLRRLNGPFPGTPGFWKIMGQRGMPSTRAGEEWALIVKGISLMANAAGRGHDPRISVGRALAGGPAGRSEADGQAISEDRLQRLLSATGGGFQSMALRAVHTMAAQRRRWDWTEMAWLILHTDHDEQEAGRCRLTIARDYYNALS